MTHWERDDGPPERDSFGTDLARALVMAAIMLLFVVAYLILNPIVNP